MDEDPAPTSKGTGKVTISYEEDMDSDLYVPAPSNGAKTLKINIDLMLVCCSEEGVHTGQTSVWLACSAGSLQEVRHTRWAGRTAGTGAAPWEHSPCGQG